MKLDAITYYTDNPMGEWNTLQKIASNTDYKGSEYIGNAVFTGYSLDKVVYPASGFGEYLSQPFEGIEVPIPCGWEDQLRIQFGNYLDYPPIKDRGVRHSDIVYDADRPYTDYLI